MLSLWVYGNNACVYSSEWALPLLCVHSAFGLLIKITIGTKLHNRWSVLNPRFTWQPFAYAVLFIVLISKIDGSWQEVLKQLIKATDILSAVWVTGIYYLHLNRFVWISHHSCQNSPLALSKWFLKSGWERCFLKQYQLAVRSRCLSSMKFFLAMLFKYLKIIEVVDWILFMAKLRTTYYSALWMLYEKNQQFGEIISGNLIWIRRKPLCSVFQLSFSLWNAANSLWKDWSLAAAKVFHLSVILQVMHIPIPYCHGSDLFDELWSLCFFSAPLRHHKTPKWQSSHV